jgi:hypothetical protein
VSRTRLALSTAAVVAGLTACAGPPTVSVGAAVYSGSGYYDSMGWYDPWRDRPSIPVGPPPASRPTPLPAPLPRASMGR